LQAGATACRHPFSGLAGSTQDAIGYALPLSPSVAKVASKIPPPPGSSGATEPHYEDAMMKLLDIGKLGRVAARYPVLCQLKLDELYSQ
jgi:hypothetical protein